MALVSADAHGRVYEFSLGDEDMPAIAHFTTNRLELKFEEELKVVARDPQGVIRAMVASKPGTRKITATVIGYIEKGFTPAVLPSSFNFEDRFYIILGSGHPRILGDYNNLTLEAESYSGMTSLAIG
jgi:hypothetical protein